MVPARLQESLQWGWGWSRVPTEVNRGHRSTEVKAKQHLLLAGTHCERVDACVKNRSSTHGRPNGEVRELNKRYALIPSSAFFLDAMADLWA